MDLKPKVILVVGGASGIGRATVELCAERGATVILADMDEKSGQLVALSAHARFMPVNVAEEDSVKTLYAQIDADWPPGCAAALRRDSVGRLRSIG